MDAAARGGAGRRGARLLPALSHLGYAGGARPDRWAPPAKEQPRTPAPLGNLRGAEGRPGDRVLGDTWDA